MKKDLLDHIADTLVVLAIITGGIVSLVLMICLATWAVGNVI